MWIKQLITLALVSCLVAPAWGANEKRQLQGIKNEIREKKRLITRTKRVEKVVAGELAKIDKSLREKEESLAALNRDLSNVDAGLRKTHVEIDTVVKDVEARKKLLQKRLVSVYKAGDAGAVRFLFSSESVPRMMENFRYMKSLMENDRKLVVAYNERLEKLKVLKTTLEQDVRRKASLKQRIELKKKEIEAEKKKKTSYLVRVREDKKSYIASLRELEANSRRLQAIIERLEAARRKSYTAHTRRKAVKPGSKGGASFVPPSSSTGFGSQKGRLSLPTQGRIVDFFGRHKHPEFNSYTNINGIFIAAPVGADVRAVYDGKVIFAEYFKGYGNMVIVDHGDGFFSLYAHNSKIFKKAGAGVKKNELVASVGDLDSTRGPVLYFEIRYQGKPIDPGPWIR
ncbi:MAG TPA: peptidoglycan DD-metalloendopeptidase family protein [Geobacteraceae bacterium]|nr:peptidoglycan DD-metalloendopeptidase family protein [Geobacteraceae bacterium]